MDPVVNWDAVEWVMLDMDGTVLDLAYDNYFWRDFLPERYAEHHGLTLKHAREVLLPKFLAVQHTLPWYSTRYWSEVTGLDVAALKREIKARIRVLEGSEIFLRHVKDQGLKLWLATNAHADSWQLKMEHTGLLSYFDQIVCSHDYDAPKEDPRFWERLGAERHFDKARALFVDDSLPVLGAARAFGIGQVVGLRHPDSTQPKRELDWSPAADRLVELLP
jgi:putative hydrolase of the HAD superfamily